eukprot:TRINITY_DN1145_c0_g2_i1.p1 TRINITY_DN1145_c0_g2~~TRINITY_DN1145_c0_g2_i1.p1  ORF type:complete len:631 (-),score=227.56 TRINITY_DN1145_c0_g2_i1:242-2089(-)
MSLNPNAASFSFNPNASSFTPGGFTPTPIPTPAAAAPAPAPAPGGSVVREIPGPAVVREITRPAVVKEVVATPAPAPTPAPETPVAEAESTPVVEEKTESWEKAAEKSEADLTETSNDESELNDESEMDDEDEEDDGDEDGEPKKKKKAETKKQKQRRLDAEAEAEAEAKDDSREHMSVVFIGHVDAGKSTISGQVLFTTGMVDARTIEKYEREAKEKNRESWFLAYIMDTNEEERAKGKTVEVGRAFFATNAKRYTILDAPGHKSYVPNMITGVAQADVGILVISARKGEFEAGFNRSGQTREHAILAKTLGVRKLVVVINKMDESTVMWSEKRFNEIKDKITPFLKSIGYGRNSVTYIPISGYTGSNIARKEIVEGTWYSGPTMLEHLDSLSPLGRETEKDLRIPLLGRYKESGKTYLLGKVESGILRVQDNITVMPGNIEIPVLSLENDQNPISIAYPGEMVKIITKCTQVEEDSINKGVILQHTEAEIEIPVTDELVCQVVLMELLENKPLFSSGYEAIVHIHTATEEFTVVRILEEINPKTGKTQKRLPAFVSEKGVCVVHIKLARPIPVEKYSDYQQMGRLTFRDEGKTIGFGKVLATNAPRRKGAADA